jgi:hypothetical protein
MYFAIAGHLRPYMTWTVPYCQAGDDVIEMAKN